MMINRGFIQESLEKRLGIPFSVETGSLPDKIYCKSRLTDLESGRGFYIQSDLKWRTLRSTLVFEEFSKPMVMHLGSASDAGKTGFLDFLAGSLNSGVYSDFRIRINDLDLTKADPALLWYSFELSIEQSPINIEIQNETAYIFDQQLVLFVSILMLMNLEPVENIDELETAGLPEGALSRVEVNKYERNRINRNVCLMVNGTNCKVCGFNFEETYGPLGNGFIHVHHITPISDLKPGYVINPVKDLVPVCPNCHAMIHRENPPLKHEDLKNLLWARHNL